MPLFNDRRNTNPAVDLADYNNKKADRWVMEPQGANLPTDYRSGSKWSNITPAMRDTIINKVTYGQKRYAGQMTPNQEKSAAAYQQSWIGKGQKASNDAYKAKPSKPNYTTPGGLVLNELKKQKKNK
jgi:hypothetical protein